MAKTKNSGKNHYEILYIISNKFTEEESKEIDKKVQEIITKADGEITYSEVWGKKKLAYTIERFTYGYYFLHEFDLWGRDLAKIDKLFRMSSDVLRHQIVKTKKKTLEEIKQSKAAEAKILAEEKKALGDKQKESLVKKKEASSDEIVKEGKKKQELVTESKEDANDDNKVDLKDLDQKLDDILDSSDLL